MSRLSMSSQRMGWGLVLSAAALVAAPPGSGARGQPADDGTSPLVLVSARTPGVHIVSTGFAIGDGSLVVTAHHVIVRADAEGASRVDALVAVISPYLGEACEPEVVAVDVDLDLAVLRTPWAGHPAYRLADDDAVLGAASVRLVSLYPVSRAMVAVDPGALDPERLVDAEELAVDFVGVRSSVPRLIQTRSAGRTAVGWSGSPMLLARDSVAAMVSTLRLQRGREGPLWTTGPAMAQVRRLLRQAGAVASLEPRASLKSPDDAPVAFRLLAESILFAEAERHAEALERARALLQVRPQSGFSHLTVARQLEDLEQDDLAGVQFRRALELGPFGLAASVHYGQYLTEQGKEAEALAVLESCWNAGKNPAVLAIPICNILRSQKKQGECIERVKQALDGAPQNSLLWLYLAQCHGEMGEELAAVRAYEQAVTLHPTRSIIRAAFAETLEGILDLERAESQYRELVRRDSQTATWQFLLARFLAKHRPQARQEALRAAEAALALPDEGRPPRQAIESLIDRLKRDDGGD